MILDTLEHLAGYAKLHPLMAQAVEFLGRGDLAELADGKIEIAGESLFALIMREPGRTRDAGQLEAHRRYTDIQLVLSGTERMGWRPVESCREPVAEFDAQKDLIFYRDEPDSWVTVCPGQFAMFSPWDAHLPMVSDGVLHKVVLKLALSEVD